VFYLPYPIDFGIRNSLPSSVRGFDDTLERDALDVTCAGPSAPCTQEGTPAPVAGNNNGDADYAT
jgi:hypothetical protein